MVIASADENGMIEIEAIDAAAVLQTILDADINVQIDQLFELPSPDRTIVNTQGSGKIKLTSHRTLTSDEIIEEKQNAQSLKGELKRIKEEKKEKKKGQKKRVNVISSGKYALCTQHSRHV